jgi:dehydrodolichyl diphosphate syntase complex subunit NUS1
LKPFLPSEPSDSEKEAQKKKALRDRRQRASQNRKPLAGPIRTFLHLAIYHVVALLFSIFFRFRRAYRLVRGKVVSLLKYHHRTPEFIAHDVKDLEKLPKHLSVIVEYQEDDGSQGTAGLEGLVNDVCEIAAWAASAGIPFLSVYERTGKSTIFLPNKIRKGREMADNIQQAYSRTTCLKPTPPSGQP